MRQHDQKIQLPLPRTITFKKNKMKNLFSILIALTIACLANAQSYLPTTGGTLTGNLIINPGNQIQVPYLGLNAGNNPPANSSNVSIFPNNTTVTLDIVGWSNGWNFIPVGQTPYPGPVVSIDNNGNIHTNGNIGIGTATPISKLHISGDNYLTIGDYSTSNGAKGIQFPGFRDVANNYFGASIEAVPYWSCCGNYPNGGYPGIKNIGLNFNVHNNQDIPDSKLTAMVIVPGGNIGIGTTNPTVKLAVAGNIQAYDVMVKTGWADYVFDSSYELKPLSAVADYIQQNRHLPNIPSAEEVSKNGIALGEMNKKLLEKVEELTLYAIKQNEETKELKKQNEESMQQKEEIDLLKKQNTELLKRIEKLENKK